jgi:hypothetical protein
MRIPRPALAYLTVVWVLVALYPDPGLVLRSVHNISTARADAAAARPLAARLPSDPQRIEAYVLSTPYSYDWQTFGVPWYFPTAAEALRLGRGDCESRAVRLASLLTAKGIPNELRVGINHIWVEYPGKQANLMENVQLEVAGHRDGSFFIHWPEQLRLRQEVVDQFDITWRPMPLARLLVLLGGLLLVPLINVWAGAFGGRRTPRPGELLTPLPAPLPGGRRPRPSTPCPVSGREMTR